MQLYPLYPPKIKLVSLRRSLCHRQRLTHRFVANVLHLQTVLPPRQITQTIKAIGIGYRTNGIARQINHLDNPEHVDPLKTALCGNLLELTPLFWATRFRSMLTPTESISSHWFWFS